MPSSSRTCWIVACAAGSWLAGCDGSPPADTQATAQAAQKAPKPVVNPLPPEMVAAVTSARNAGAVGVHFALKGAPIVSKALPVDIAVVPHVPLASLSAHFEARDGLAVATGNEIERLTDPAPEKVIKHQLILLPSKEGVFMVTVIVDTVGSEGNVARIFSIPVIVSAAEAAEAGKAESPPPAAPVAPATPAATSGDPASG